MYLLIEASITRNPVTPIQEIVENCLEILWLVLEKKIKLQNQMYTHHTHVV